MVYEVWWSDEGIEQLLFEVDNAIVAGVLFDYVRQVVNNFNDMSSRFCMDCYIHAREL